MRDQRLINDFIVLASHKILQKRESSVKETIRVSLRFTLYITFYFSRLKKRGTSRSTMSEK